MSKTAVKIDIQKPIKTSEDYINSLRGRNLKVYLFGELVEEIVDHPMIRPSINAVAETYDLAEREPELATATSHLTGEKVNRFLNIVMDRDNVVLQNKMQRRLGQLTGTCFQRCVGMDAINSLYSVTFEIDEKFQTNYHERLKEFIKEVQTKNLVIGGAMTDVKGDRSLAPHEQADPDLFVHITNRTDEGVYISGAKAHQTGCLNSHWLIVMPTMRLTENDKDYAIVGAIPVEADGITYIYGRQSCDTRSMEGGTIDVGNANYGGQEAMVIFENVFIPNELIFMDGETEFASMLVERFTCYHRRSYVCKSGLGDVMIGAAAQIAEYNGVEKVSHIKDKLVEMTHLNETIYATGIASSYQSKPTKIGRVFKRRYDRQCLQTSRYKNALRDRTARAGFGGRSGRYTAVGKRFPQRRSRASSGKILKRSRRRFDRKPDANSAPHRKYDARQKRRRLSHRINARRRLAPSPTHPNRPTNADRIQKTTGKRISRN